MSVSTHLVWLSRWNSTMHLYSSETKMLIGKILLLCNKFTIPCSQQRLCDFSKQIKGTNWNTMRLPLFLCSKKGIFSWVFLSAGKIWVIFYWFFILIQAFFECVRQHLKTLEDISMSSLETRVTRLSHKSPDRNV